MNKQTGAQLHAMIDALRGLLAHVESADCHATKAGGVGAFAYGRTEYEQVTTARKALTGQPLAALTLLADDIECDGMGGPFATHLSFLISQERDETRKLFFSRLLGNVKKFNSEYGQ